MSQERGIDAVLSRLDGARRSGKGWLAKCPAHQDRSPSLSLSEGDKGNVLLHCHAGCEAIAVLDALGLDFETLFPAGLESKSKRTPVAASTALEILEFEALFLRIVCNDIGNGGIPDTSTIERVRLAHDKILDAYRLTR